MPNPEKAAALRAEAARARAKAELYREKGKTVEATEVEAYAANLEYRATKYD